MDWVLWPLGVVVLLILLASCLAMGSGDGPIRTPDGGDLDWPVGDVASPPPSNLRSFERAKRASLQRVAARSDADEPAGV